MKDCYILSIEDNKNDIALMTRIFDRELSHCDVKYIQDGESAVRFIESPEFEDNPPKCILLDIKLPKMNGLEVLNYLRNKRRIKHIPVVMLSSSDRPDEIDETYNLGGNSYIEKPKSYTDLKKKLPKIVDYWVNYNR